MNSWDDAGFREAIEATGRKNILMTGLWTEVCVTWPTIEMLGAGYNIYVVEDCCGATSPAAHEAALSRMVQAGAVRVTTIPALLEWQRDWAKREHYDNLMGSDQRPGRRLRRRRGIRLHDGSPCAAVGRQASGRAAEGCPLVPASRQWAIRFISRSPGAFARNASGSSNQRWPNLPAFPWPCRARGACTCCIRRRAPVRRNTAFFAASPAPRIETPSTNRVSIREWLKRIEPMVEGEASYRNLGGLEAWFRDPHGPMPPRWKMALLTWIAVWPVSLAGPRGVDSPSRPDSCSHHPRRRDRCRNRRRSHLGRHAAARPHRPSLDSPKNRFL